MKMEGALEKRFFRHDGIYRSDVSSHLLPLARRSRFRSGRRQGIEHAGKNVLFPSSAMSSGRLFLDRVARLQSPSPLHRPYQNKTIASAGERNYHRTVHSVLTVCLAKQGNPIQHRRTRFLRESHDVSGDRRGGASLPVLKGCILYRDWPPTGVPIEISNRTAERVELPLNDKVSSRNQMFKLSLALRECLK